MLVLLLPLGGTYLFFKSQQYKIRKEIKRKIKNGVKNEDLVLLKIPKVMEEFPNNDFQRIHSKEFRYKGEMYDIVEQETFADTTYYWCIWDKEETALFATLDETFNLIWNKNPIKKNTNEKIQIFIKSLFYENDNLNFQANFLKAKKQNFLFKNSFYQTPHIKQNFPPPELFA